MKAKIEKTLSARTRSRVVRTKRNTPKRSEERNERKIDRFRQKVDKKRRKDLRFFPNLHTIFSMPTHCAHRDKRNRHKRAAPTARNGVTPPLQHSHIERKTNHRNKKQTPNSCLSRKMILLLPKPHRKTPYIARFSHTSRPTLHPLQLVPRIGSVALRGLYL